MMVSTINDIIGSRLSGILASCAALPFARAVSSAIASRASRQEAFDHMCAHATQAGANAVIGMRYDANEIMDGITEVLAYGTAVWVEPVVGRTCETFGPKQFWRWNLLPCDDE
jgi:hypothetical protein